MYWHFTYIKCTSEINWNKCSHLVKGPIQLKRVHQMGLIARIIDSLIFFLIALFTRQYFGIQPFKFVLVHLVWLLAFPKYGHSLSCFICIFITFVFDGSLGLLPQVNIWFFMVIKYLIRYSWTLLLIFEQSKEFVNRFDNLTQNYYKKTQENESKVNEIKTIRFWRSKGKNDQKL